MNVGSLFSGIGGFDLGLERAGFHTSWFCEQDDYCTRVLNRHWPRVPVYPDVTTLTAGEVEPVDVLVGGFPCQDISLAGKGAGLEGARSGLWSEYARLIGELRPRYVIVENVTALLGRGFGRVLGDLAALGFDAEWDCIPASAVGAPHRRDRVWIVAYPSGEGLEGHGAPSEFKRKSPTLGAMGAANLWPTPTAWLGRRPSQSLGDAERYWNPARSNELSDAVAASGTPGRLNPMWVEWLMGFPLGWTDLSASEMLLSHKSLSGSGGES